MSTLIVDDEQGTREALRSILQLLGHRVVLEARDGEEALRMLASERGRVDLIIADWEMPYMDGLTLVRRVAGIPELDLASFLLITSDLPRSAIEEFRREVPRLDGHLIKPFRSAALGRAILEAHETRARSRSRIGCIGPSLKPFLDEAVAARESGFWREVVVVADLGRGAAENRALGAVFVDPQAVPGTGEIGLAAFKKTRLGGATPVVCLSRDASRIQPYRLHCQFFADAGVAKGFWAEWLERLEVRALHHHEIDALLERFRAELQAGRAREALAAARRAVELDPFRSEARVAVGDAMDFLGFHEEATDHFRAALEINPCLPRPYLRIAAALPRGAAGERADLARTAASYCPGNEEIKKLAGGAGL